MKHSVLIFLLCLLLAGCSSSPAVTPTTLSSVEQQPTAESSPSGLSLGEESQPTSADASAPSHTASKENSQSPSVAESTAAPSSATSSQGKKPTDITNLTPSAPSTPTAPETLHITKGGSYSLTGQKKDVMITVDAGEEEVTLTLAGVTVTNQKGPALYVKSAKKVNLILSAGTKNILCDGSSYTLTDGTTTLDAALFSRSDLHIAGEGSLEIQGNYKHGLVSKDDLKISGGTYQITAKNVALEGKDSVKISGGNFTLSAGSDGVRATNIERADKGFVEISGGTFTVTAGNDSIQASTNITLSGGTLTLRAGQSGVQAEGSYRQTGGEVTLFGTQGSGKALLNAKTAASIEGGTFLGFGDNTKAKHFTNAKGGCALLLPFANQSANTPFVLTKDGNQVVKATPTVAYSLALVYTPALTTGDYTLTLGNKTAGFTVNTNLFTLQ